MRAPELPQLGVAYRITEDAYYLVSQDGTAALRLPSDLHCDITEIVKAKGDRVSNDVYGANLIPWPHAEDVFSPHKAGEPVKIGQRIKVYDFAMDAYAIGTVRAIIDNAAIIETEERAHESERGRLITYLFREGEYGRKPSASQAA